MGGKNDRFDMILYSNGVALPDGVYYEPGTFNNIGNDGNHFDRAINNGPNAAVPSNIAMALYNCSDHLPVEMILKFGRTIGIDELNTSVSSMEVFPNPVTERSVVRFNLLKREELKLSISDMTGKLISEVQPSFYENGENMIELGLSPNVSAGVYLLTLSGDKVLINRKINSCK